MNDGSKFCGAHYTIELNQEYVVFPFRFLSFCSSLHLFFSFLFFSLSLFSLFNCRQPLTILVSTEGRGVGISQFRDPTQYCVYVDLQYNDGDNLFGQVIPFSEGTHVIQYKYVQQTQTKEREIKRRRGKIYFFILSY